MNDEYDPVKNPRNPKDLEKLTIKQLEERRQEAAKELPTPQFKPSAPRPKMGQLGADAQTRLTQQQHADFAKATNKYNAVNNELIKQQKEPVSGQHKREFNQKTDREYKDTQKKIEERIKQMQEKQRERERQR